MLAQSEPAPLAQIEAAPSAPVDAFTPSREVLFPVVAPEHTMASRREFVRDFKITVRTAENTFRSDVTVVDIVSVFKSELTKNSIKGDAFVGGSSVPYLLDKTWQRDVPHDADPLFIVQTQLSPDALAKAIDNAMRAALRKSYGAEVSHLSDWRGDGCALRRVRVGISGKHLDLRVLDSRHATPAYDFTINAGLVRFDSVIGNGKLKLEALPGTTADAIMKHRTTGLAVLDHTLTDDGLVRLWKMMTQGFVPVASEFMAALPVDNLRAIQHPKLAPGEEDTIGTPLRRAHCVTKARESVNAQGAAWAVLANATAFMRDVDSSIEGAPELLAVLRATLDACLNRCTDPATRALLGYFKVADTGGLDLLSFWIHLCASDAPAKFDASARPAHTQATRVMAGECPWNRLYVAGLGAYILLPDEPMRAVHVLNTMPDVAGIAAAPMQAAFTRALGLDANLRQVWELTLPPDFWSNDKARTVFADRLLALENHATDVGWRTRLLLAAISLQPQRTFSAELLALAEELPAAEPRESLRTLALKHRARAFVNALRALQNPVSISRQGWDLTVALLQGEEDPGLKTRMAQHVWSALADGKLCVDAAWYQALGALLAHVSTQPTPAQAEKIAAFWLKVADDKASDAVDLSQTLRGFLDAYLSNSQEDFPLHTAVDTLAPDAVVRRLVAGDLDVDGASVKRLSALLLSASRSALMDNEPLLEIMLERLAAAGAVPEKLFRDAERVKAFMTRPTLLASIGHGLSQSTSQPGGVVHDWVRHASQYRDGIAPFFARLDPDDAMYLPTAQALCAAPQSTAELVAHMLTTWNTYRERHPDAGARIADVLLSGLQHLKSEGMVVLATPAAVSAGTLQQWYSALQHVPISNRIDATRLLGAAFLARGDVTNLQSLVWEFVPLLKRRATRDLLHDLFIACVDKLLEAQDNRVHVVRAATALFEQTPAPNRKGETTFRKIQANLFTAQLQCSLESEAVATLTRLYATGCDLGVCEKQMGISFGALTEAEQESLLPALTQVVLKAASIQPSVVRVARHLVRAREPKDYLMWILALHPFCQMVPEPGLVDGLQEALAEPEALRDFETRLDAMLASGGPKHMQSEAPMSALLNAYLKAAGGGDPQRVERVNTWLGQAMGEKLSVSTTADLETQLGVLATFVQLVSALWVDLDEKQQKVQIAWLSAELIALDKGGGHLRLLLRAAAAIPDAGRTMALSMLRRMNSLAKTDLTAAQGVCTRIIYFATQTLAQRGGSDLAAAEMTLLLLTKSVGPLNADAKSMVAHWIDHSLGWFAPGSVTKLQAALADANLADIAKEPYPLNPDGPTWQAWMEASHPVALAHARDAAFFDELDALQATCVLRKDFSQAALLQFHDTFQRKFSDDAVREQMRMIFENSLRDKDKSDGPRGQMNLAHLVLEPMSAVSKLTPDEFSTYMRLCAARFYTNQERDTCQKLADFVISNAHPQSFEADSVPYMNVVHRFKSLADSKGAGNKAWGNKVLAQLAAASRPSSKA